MTKTKETTYAEDLAVQVKTNRTKKDKEKKEAKQRLMQRLVSEVIKHTKHRTRVGEDNCEIHFPDVYENDPEMKDTVILDFRKELIRSGFNQREIVWAFHDGHEPENENGRHLVLRLAWDKPLDVHSVNNLLNPPSLGQ